MQNCVWEAPSCLTKVIALEREYKDCKLLFCTQLRLKNATIEHVIDEILSPQDFERRKELLLVLNNYLRSKRSSLSVEKLKGKMIIPVRMVAKPRDQTALKNYDRHVWYLADKPSLQESFKEKVWLIDFPLDVVRKLSPLVKAMGLENYLLSNAVEEETECCGDPILDQDRTMDLRKRVLFFMRLVSLS